jgi:hypothetical protein
MAIAIVGGVIAINFVRGPGVVGFAGSGIICWHLPLYRERQLQGNSTPFLVLREIGSLLAECRNRA